VRATRLAAGWRGGLGDVAGYTTFYLTSNSKLRFINNESILSNIILHALLHVLLELATSIATSATSN
jgi:hypothetical protein